MPDFLALIPAKQGGVKRDYIGIVRSKCFLTFINGLSFLVTNLLCVDNITVRKQIKDKLLVSIYHESACLVVTARTKYFVRRKKERPLIPNVILNGPPTITGIPIAQ